MDGLSRPGRSPPGPPAEESGTILAKPGETGAGMALAFVVRAQGDTPPGEPVAPKPERRGQREDPSCSAEPRTAVDVLVVDDDAGVRTSLAMILRGAGYTVAVAEDGRAALQALAEHDVAMVLLDLKMPRMDGVTFLETVDVPPPIVVLSAFPLDKEAERRVGSKLLRQLAKPVYPLVLLEAVANVLGRA
jgi:two-component system, chemotaxis family, chemotaxis protein CheY